VIGATEVLLDELEKPSVSSLHLKIL
jgi:hypothetical protein